MYAIALNVADRELVNEIANREPAMEEVRAEMEASEKWDLPDTQTFLISYKNLERYLAYVYGVYISKCCQVQG